MCGDPGSGKTSLITALSLSCGGSTPTTLTTPDGLSLPCHRVLLPDTTTPCDLVEADTPSTTTSLLPSASVVLVLHDVCAEPSFLGLQGRWLPVVGRAAEARVVMVIGTKTDRRGGRACEIGRAEELTVSRGIFYMEVSAKEGTNVLLTAKLVNIRLGTRPRTPSGVPGEMRFLGDARRNVLASSSSSSSSSSSGIPTAPNAVTVAPLALAASPAAIPIPYGSPDRSSSSPPPRVRLLDSAPASDHHHLHQQQLLSATTSTSFSSETLGRPAGRWMASPSSLRGFEERKGASVPVFGTSLVPRQSPARPAVPAATSTSSSYSASMFTPRGPPLVTGSPGVMVEVCVGPRRVGTMLVREGDDPLELARSFAEAHGLSERWVAYLADLVRSRVSDHFASLLAAAALDDRAPLPRRGGAGGAGGAPSSGHVVTTTTTTTKKRSKRHDHHGQSHRRSRSATGYNSSKRHVLFKVAIKLPRGRTEEITVHPGSDARALASSFAREHGLPSDARERILGSILAQAELLGLEDALTGWDDDDERNEEEEDSEEEENVVVERRGGGRHQGVSSSARSSSKRPTSSTAPSSSRVHLCTLDVDIDGKSKRGVINIFSDSVPSVLAAKFAVDHKLVPRQEKDVENLIRQNMRAAIL